MSPPRRLAKLLTSVPVLVGLCTNSPLLAADAPFWPRFHGPKGDNISTDTGLLTEWPERGPRLLWTAHPLGKGYAGVTIANGLIYTAGDIGDHNVITALDMNGQIQWQFNNGSSWTRGAQGTPTVDDNRLYHENAHEEVVCLDAKTGKKTWGLNLASKFGGRKGGYGRAESLLIDGDYLICSPGGKTAVAAVDKTTGQVVWKSPSVGEPASYVSPIVTEYQGLRMIITMSQKCLIAVNADTGDLLWRFEHYTERYVANCVTPIYYDGHVFVTGGYGRGSVLLEIDVDGQKATIEPAWRTEDLDNRHGGVILLNGYLYGASHLGNNAKWVCLDWKTGQMMYAERGVGQGSLACADGMLYTLSERRKMGLVKPTPAGHQVISQFKIPEGGEGPTWAHPVVYGGRLYVRHGDQLYAYDVRGE
ncbi:MAG: PQQ-binding-like beta-propeller repeat protein [Pirellulaceae bacterium]|nr:PQQ-binding-like beta-propeller repeat protein [Pirellulaceae bacterium]HJN13713.1 PQQ-binding-like beta-propeller repeat protein [Pirellulaceae bacterium]